MPSVVRARFVVRPVRLLAATLVVLLAAAVALVVVDVRAGARMAAGEQAVAAARAHLADLVAASAAGEDASTIIVEAGLESLEADTARVLVAAGSAGGETGTSVSLSLSLIREADRWTVDDTTPVP